MKLALLVGVVSVTLVVVISHVAEPRRIDVSPVESLEESFDAFISNDQTVYDDVTKINKTVEAMKKIIGALGRQMLLQQLFLEEKIRSDASSGVKKVRHVIDGTRNYYSSTHTRGSVVAIHDHTNNIRTIGMGEFVGVLNGVEFRTRHNDYRLYMPHRTKKDFHAYEEIPFPEVPPEVLNKNTVQEQINEMREWFKAWKDQDHSVRDYRKYFKPVLCYLEGAWTTSTNGKVDEPFESDRHFVDASSWFDLQEKIRFTSYTGRKDNLENFSFLPTTIMNITEKGYPEFAQWNYRIMCHPLNKDLPLNRMRVVDELGVRMSFKRSYMEHSMTRAARFQVNPKDEDTYEEGFSRERYGLLDDMMSEIPGKDNYAANLTDDAFDMMAFSTKPKIKIPLRASHYHRWFEVAEKGAMGISFRHRGFSDDNVFMAMNTQSKIAGMNLNRCTGKGKNKVCASLNQKWSYAIPLEIIYMTPLYKWNPYKLIYKGDERKPWGKTVYAGGRNGGMTPQKAYNGTNSKKYYQTPVEFFSGAEVGSGEADTTKGSVGVLDRDGNVRKCSASGTRIFIPQIPDVGVLRQRYPIMPIHGEGSSVWKELEATKDLLLKSRTNGYIFREPLSGSGGPIPTVPTKPLRYQTMTAKETPPGPHVHDLVITPDQAALIKGGRNLIFATEEAAGHFHRLTLKRSNAKRFVITKCDDKDTGKTRCWDGHGKWVNFIPDQ